MKNTIFCKGLLEAAISMAAAWDLDCPLKRLPGMNEILGRARKKI